MATAPTGETIFERVDPDDVVARVKAVANHPPRDWHHKVAFRRQEYIFERVAAGASFKVIAGEITQKAKWPVDGSRLRRAILEHDDLQKRYLVALQDRAHAMVEHAGDMVLFAAQAGDFDKSGKLALALAEKVAPNLYGAKRTVEITGKDGGPIKSEVVQTPEDAYRAMLNGTQDG